MRTSRVPSTGAAELMNFNRLVLGSCFTPAHGRCRGGLHVPELRQVACKMPEPPSQGELKFSVPEQDVREAFPS